MYGFASFGVPFARKKGQRMAWNKKTLAALERLPGRIPSAVPAYQRIQSVIRKRIDSGQLQPGDAVPSERDLARTHHVSLMTARHALAFLEREGLVERRRSIGTFVAPPKIHFNKLMSYTEQMAARTLAAGAKVLLAKIIDHENEAAARLSLPPKSGIIKFERLRHASGEPFAVETCYLSAPEFPGLLNASLESESLFGILERDYKVELSYADEEVDATAADPRIADLLAIPRREPVLRIRQVIYSTLGKAVMYVMGFYRSDRHNLVIRRFR
jgi:GntR family transcriptional regulator